MTNKNCKYKNKAQRRLFTMMEMLAVLVIVSILCAMTIGIFKTDSTTANARMVSGAILKAKSYAMSNATNVQITFNPNDLTVKYDSVPTGLTALSFDKKLNVYKLKSGGSVSSAPQSTFIYKTSGEPDFTTLQTITISNGKSSVPDLNIYARPFTGKVTFYP